MRWLHCPEMPFVIGLAVVDFAAACDWVGCALSFLRRAGECRLFRNCCTGTQAPQRGVAGF
jgi:hypothetical protein